MQAEGNGVKKEATAVNPHDTAPHLLDGDAIIQFGIFCCVVTMAIVFAVAFLAN
jgi:hypothetical protein